MEEVRALNNDNEIAEDVLAAAMALRDRRVVVLTGAGISTESGIPDYRGPGTRARARTPMRFAQFAASDAWRKRYWARATVGWPRVRDAAPNQAHVALAHARVDVITQNVDSLHTRAGSAHAVELHGTLREVVCLGCGATIARDALHARLLELNPHHAQSASFAPDGDVDLDDDVIERFRVIDCEHCGGPYKPRVVFFGENVAPATLRAAWDAFDRANALLVVGSSLEVFSGRRFVEEAARRSMPIVIVNLGPTRSDTLATVRIDAHASRAVPLLAPVLAVTG